MAVQPRYTTKFTFSASAALRSPTDAERLEAKASLRDMKPMLPPSIDPEADETIVYAVGNLAVAGLVNLNDDALSIEDALRVYSRFERQQINVEHQRDNVVGYIVKAGLSELGTDRLITEEEARAAGVPFNIAIAIAFWRVVNPELCDFIIRASAPVSPDANKLSLSFEVGFDNYHVVVLPRASTDLALASAIVTSDAREFDRYDRALRVNGGSGAWGKDTSSRVARLLSGNIIPLGGGVVTVPAAAVKGIAAITENPHVVHEDDETEAGLYKYSSTQVTLPQDAAAEFIAYAAAIPEEHVYTDEADPTLGREDEPHVTACYGLTTSDPDAVKMALADCGPISVTLGKVSSFERDEKPYDVLKVDVISDDLHRANSLIKTSTEVVSSYPDYHPHLTLGYLRKGMAKHYVGDARFEGRKLAFSSITFSPKDGPRVELPLTEVYNTDDDTMATASRYIKLSAGWQARLSELKATALPMGGDPLVNGVNVTLSDGRKLANVKIFDGETLELDKELSMSGVVITDMTPGVGPQADDPEKIHPKKADIAPTTSPEQQARDKADETKRHEGAMRAYTDAALAHINRAEASVSHVAGVIAPSTPSTMNLAELKQSIASVKTVEDLPTVTANVALFAEEISRASEKLAAERKTAEEAAAAAQKTADEVKAQLDVLQKEHSEMRAAQAASEAAAKYQERMATIDEVFTLEDEVKAEIIEEVKACADDASFEKWLSKAKKMMKEKTKEFIKKKKGEHCDDETDEAKAARVAAEALASAKNNPVDAPIHGGTTLAGGKSLKDQYAEAFAGGIMVGGEKVSDLNQKPIKASRA